MKEKRFEIENFGIVGRDNMVWIHCENLDQVDSLREGETYYLDFRTGMGRNTARVTRLSDVEVGTDTEPC